MKTSRYFILAASCVLFGLNSPLSQAATPTVPQRPAFDENDKAPITIMLDVSKPGRVFDGIGGNFRLQNPSTDPAVIQYNLENLRVTWGRVAIPWREWHPNENTDPVEALKSGQLNNNVRQAMEMALTLAQKRIPVIASIWSPPQWAITGGPPRRGVGGVAEGGLRGNPLNPEKIDAICKSIASYLVCMKQYYGAEATFFSFNEADLGIDVRQTPEEHALHIKRLGACFAAQGLATKMLLGDTCDALPIKFIQPTMEDPEAMKYVGAISFHSWRASKEPDPVLAAWGDAARKANVPVLCAEAGTDSEAYFNPVIMQSPEFSMDEINLYLRICALCQVKTIMEWQLTADFSLLSGVGGRRGGRAGADAPQMQPTQRFWNLKQLGSTPAGAFALPVSCDRPSVTCAAFGDIANGTYAVHIVNYGNTRQATLTGLPATIKELRIYVTDGQRGMKEGARVKAANGKADFTLDTFAYTTLIGNSS